MKISKLQLENCSWIRTAVCQLTKNRQLFPHSASYLLASSCSLTCLAVLQRTTSNHSHCDIKERLVSGRITGHERLSHLMNLKHSFVLRVLFDIAFLGIAAVVFSLLCTRLAKHGLLSFTMAEVGRAGLLVESS